MCLLSWDYVINHNENEDENEKRSHRYNINWPRSKHRHKYSKYKMSQYESDYMQHLTPKQHLKLNSRKN